MFFNAAFRRKENSFELSPCIVSKVVELAEDEFDYFKDNLMSEHKFLEDNYDYMGVDKDNVTKALLVLCIGKDYGYLVDADGTNYARYTAYLPNARTLYNLQRYPILKNHTDKMIKIADTCADRIVRGQYDGKYIINIQNLKDEFAVPDLDENLLNDMLSDRTEFKTDGICNGEIHCSINEEFALKEKKENLTVYSPMELKKMLAKHFLWVNGDESGQQLQLRDSYFKQENFKGIDLSNAVIENCKFIDCNFSGLSMCYTEAAGTKFHNCLMTDIPADESNFENAEFRHCVMCGGDYTNANFHGAKFVQSDIAETCFLKSCMAQTEFIETSTANSNMGLIVYDYDAWKEESSDYEMRLE